MPMAAWDDVRTDVVRHLYAVARRHPPGSEMHEIASYAVLLAMSAGREARSSRFLLRNAWRDARRILRRRRHREPTVDPLDEWSALGRRIAEGDIRYAVEHVTPASICIARDLEERVRAEARAIGPDGPACLDGLLTGETLAQTAARLDVQPGTVKRIRQRIREIAARLTGAALRPSSRPRRYRPTAEPFDGGNSKLAS